MKEDSGTNSLRRYDLDKFVSVHIHKSGGTTFGFILKDMYKDKFFWDKSEDSAFLHGRVVDYNMTHVAKRDVVHGHININKYSFLARPYITWLRHPVSRLESEYSIIRQKRITKSSSPFHRRIINERLSFIDYCKIMKDVYKRYLGDMKVNDFAFVGLTEYYEESLFVFSQIVGKEIPPYHRRNSRRLYKQLFKEGSTEERLVCTKLNQKDIAFWREAKTKLVDELNRCEVPFEIDKYSPKRK